MAGCHIYQRSFDELRMQLSEESSLDCEGGQASLIPKKAFSKHSSSNTALFRKSFLPLKKKVKRVFLLSSSIHLFFKKPTISPHYPCSAAERKTGGGPCVDDQLQIDVGRIRIFKNGYIFGARLMIFVFFTGIMWVVRVPHRPLFDLATL